MGASIAVYHLVLCNKAIKANTARTVDFHFWRCRLRYSSGSSESIFAFGIDNILIVLIVSAIVIAIVIVIIVTVTIVIESEV